MLDLGLAAKARPGVILSAQFQEDEKAVVTYVARSTQQHGGRFEVEHHASQFVPGVFDAQNIGTVPVVKEPSLYRYSTRRTDRRTALPPAASCRQEPAVRPPTSALLAPH